MIGHLGDFICLFAKETVQLMRKKRYASILDDVTRWPVSAVKSPEYASFSPSWQESCHFRSLDLEGNKVHTLTLLPWWWKNICITWQNETCRETGGGGVQDKWQIRKLVLCHSVNVCVSAHVCVCMCVVVVVVGGNFHGSLFCGLTKFFTDFCHFKKLSLCPRMKPSPVQTVWCNLVVVSESEPTLAHCWLLLHLYQWIQTSACMLVEP